MLNQQKIAFMGAGSMAEAMISGIVESGIIPAANILVTNKNNSQRLLQLQNTYGVQPISQDALATENFDMLVIAMKPKDIEDALQQMKTWLSLHTVVLSVIAGVSTTYIQEMLGTNQPVVRVMPNTSSMIRESATAVSPGEYATEEQLEIAKIVLTSIGKVFVVDESQMDLFTGIAGSGPAYFYYLIEQMEQFAITSGLAPNLARDIAVQTIYGAAKMMKTRIESPSELRMNVTSPNGTTQAGLEALTTHGGKQAIQEAIKAATARSAEMRTAKEKV